MSTSADLVIRSARHEAAVRRLMTTSKRTAAEVMKAEARIVFTQVAKITPPYSGGSTGRQAEKMGKVKIAAEINALYGTPGEAYDLVAERSPAKASAFWLLHQEGEIQQANAVLREATGSILYPFDGGAHHRKNYRRGSRQKSFQFFVSNPQSLDMYIQQQQSRVWWLASGWQDALVALGVKPPYGADRHSAAPGTLRIDANDARISITMLNDVSFAAGVSGLSRRIRWALEVRADRLQRQWDFYLERLAGQTGMKAK